MKKLSPIENLPTDVHYRVLSTYLSDNDLSKLSHASRPLFFACQKPLQEKAAKKLLAHVVKGEEAQALHMLDANPKLLLQPAEATDYSGRVYTGYTPFQAALLCHDVTLWKKMEPFFTQLEGGPVAKAQQFNALFPEGIRYRKPYDFGTLTAAITASSAENIQAALEKIQNGTAICNALNDFRRDFTAVSMQEVFFNPAHLIEALKVCDEQCRHWSEGQRDLFWRQVVGYTQRYLPASQAQTLVQGLFNLFEWQEPFKRSFKIKYGEDAGSYFPLLDSTGLGFDWGMYLSSQGCEEVAGWGDGSTWNMRLRVYKLRSANTAELLKLEHRIQQGEAVTNSFWCTIS